MKINKLAYKALVLVLLGNLTLASCSEKEFEPPNKTSIKTGQADKVVPVGTAIKIMKYSDKMAKAWDADAVLMGINGVHVGFDGYNRTDFVNSQWIMTYFSPKKPQFSNTYTITFNGKGMATWLEGTGNYDLKNNILNFSVDSDKAISEATKGGLPEGKIYTVELSKNSKGMYWFVGSKPDEAAPKYSVKRVDALSGAVSDIK